MIIYCNVDERSVCLSMFRVITTEEGDADIEGTDSVKGMVNSSFRTESFSVTFIASH